MINTDLKHIAFVVPGVAISGGINVIFQHATYLAKQDGFEVIIIHEKPVSPLEVIWHPNSSYLKFMSLNEAKKCRFDVVFATFWSTVYDLFRLNAHTYGYFVQSIESRFYKQNEIEKRSIVDYTYSLGLKVITEATWIRDYLQSEYNTESLLVKNGIRKDFFYPDGSAYSNIAKDGLRILVEGPLDVEFKNVINTLSICKKSEADEIWLLTSTANASFDLANRVFCNVPINEVPNIMRSCDLIVKLSYVEGMFGPPLEMFHCGGTAIVYSVSGCDEYIVNGYNGIIINKDDLQGVIEAINNLRNDRDRLRYLKSNAIKTAEEWPDWEQSSNQFLNATNQLLKETGNGMEMRLQLKNAAEKYKKHLFVNNIFSWIKFSIIDIPWGWKLVIIAKKAKSFVRHLAVNY